MYEIVTLGSGLIVTLLVLYLCFISYRCVRSMENACALTAAAAKVWTAPLALEKAPPLVLQDVTPQGHRWHHFSCSPFFSFFIFLIYCTGQYLLQQDKLTPIWFCITMNLSLGTHSAQLEERATYS